MFDAQRDTPGLVPSMLHPVELTTQPLVLVLQSLALVAPMIALPLISSGHQQADGAVVLVQHE